MYLQFRIKNPFNRTILTLYDIIVIDKLCQGCERNSSGTHKIYMYIGNIIFPRRQSKLLQEKKKTKMSVNIILKRVTSFFRIAKNHIKLNKNIHNANKIQ